MLKTDDCDIQESSLNILLGGNGDYYIRIKERKGPFFDTNTIRVSTSGGNAPSEVKIAVAELYRALEKHGLNEIE